MISQCFNAMSILSSHFQTSPKCNSMIDMNHGGVEMGGLKVIRLHSTPKSPALPLAGQ